MKNLNELSKKTLGSYVNKAEEDTEELYTITEITDEMIEEGNLPFASPHKDFTKTLVGRYSNVKAGENSKVEVHKAKSVGTLKTAISNATKSGGAAVVHVNGKPVFAVHKQNEYGHGEYGIHTDKGADSVTRRHQHHGTGKYDNRRQKYIPASYSERQSNSFSKGEAMNRVHYALHQGHGIDVDNKESYKHHDIQVHVIHPDENRKLKSGARIAARARTENPLHDKVAHRFALKYVGKEASPKSTAEELHQKLGAAISAGDLKAASHHASELETHVRRSGLGTESHKFASVKSDAKSVLAHKSSYSLERLKKLKEDTDMTDVNELVTLSEDKNLLDFRGMVDSILKEKISDRFLGESAGPEDEEEMSLEEAIMSYLEENELTEDDLSNILENMTEAEFEELDEESKDVLDAYAHFLNSEDPEEEEDETLDELSDGTLDRYMKKAERSKDKHFLKSQGEEDKAMSTDGNKYPEKQEKHQKAAAGHDRKWFNRNVGINKAFNKVYKR